VGDSAILFGGRIYPLHHNNNNSHHNLDLAKGKPEDETRATTFRIPADLEKDKAIWENKTFSHICFSHCCRSGSQICGCRGLRAVQMRIKSAAAK